MAIDWEKARENNKKRLQQERGIETETQSKTSGTGSGTQQSTAKIDWKAARARTRIALATERANAQKSEETLRTAEQEEKKNKITRGSKSTVLSPSVATGRATAPNWTERAATAASTSKIQTTDDSRPYAKTRAERLQDMQSEIDDLAQKAQQTDATGLSYYDTQTGEKELKSGLAQLSRAYSDMTGRETTFNGLAAAQEAVTELLNEKEGTKDYIGYLAGEYGTGMYASPAGILSGAKTTVGDLLTNGKISEGQKVAEQYFAERPELFDRWMANDQSAKWQAEQELGALLADVTNPEIKPGAGFYEAVTSQEKSKENLDDLTDAILSAYRTANTAQWLREKTADDRGSGISDSFKNTIGNAVYSAGQNAPGMIYGMAGGTSEAGGIVGSMIDAKASGTSVASAAATATKEALKGNISTWMIGLSSYGNQLNELAQERGAGEGLENYISAAGHGFAEMFTEGLFGLADMGAIEDIWKCTGSKSGNILRALGNYLVSSAEEGLEEFVNEPMGKIVDKMTVDHDMPLVGEGGVFDIEAMLEAGLQGALAGAVMGSVGAVTSINTAVQEGASIQSAAEEINSSIEALPDFVQKPELLDAKTATAEEVEQKSAEMMDNIKKAVDEAMLREFGSEETSEAENQSFEQGENTPVQNIEQAQNSPVQTDAQGQEENNDIMSTSVQNENAQTIQNQNQDQNQEGINNEVPPQQTVEEPQPAEQQQPAERSDVLPGDGQERGSAATDAGSTGTLGSTGETDTTKRRQNQIARTRRDNAIRDAGLKRVSTAELGIQTGTNRQTNVLLDDAFIEKDAELSSIRRRWREMNEKRRTKNGTREESQLQFVVGGMQVQLSNGETELVDGVFTGRDVIVQADSVSKSATQLAEHEEYHLMERGTKGLTREVWLSLYDANDRSMAGQMTELLEKYRRFYGEELGYTDEMIVEEIIADAYAGLERVPGTNMQQLQETVREWSAELQGYIDSGWYDTLSQDIEEEFQQSINGTRGPPTESAESAETKYSVADETETEQTDQIARAAQEYFGTTNDWNETGYLTRDGKQLDFSGGAAGNRYVDHREILDAYESAGIDDGMSGVEAMVDFMSHGNIRIMPESGGINLATEPTYEQIWRLKNFIRENDGEVILDIDDTDGRTISSTEYPEGTNANKVIRDIRNYFADGEKPTADELQRYRYSVADETEADLQSKEAEQEVLREKEERRKKKILAQGKKQLKNIMPAETYNARYIQAEIVNQLVDSIEQTGAVRQDMIDETYDTLWKESEVVDREFAEQYDQLKQELKGGVRVSENVKKEIPDWNQFRKLNFGTVGMNNSGATVDEAYTEWSREYPHFFPEDIVSEYDQLNQMVKVANMLKNKTKSMEEYFEGGDAYAAIKTEYVDFVRELEEKITGTTLEKMAAELKERSLNGERQGEMPRKSAIAEQEEGYLETIRLLEEELEAEEATGGEPEFKDEIPMEDDARIFEEYYSPDNQSAVAATEEMLRVSKEDFKGSTALNELGIRIAGNLADYSGLGIVRQVHENAESVRRDIKKAERKLQPTPTEKHLAAGIASGVLDEENIGRGVDRGKIMKLADYYAQEKIANEDLLWQRRNEIYANTDDAIKNLMNGTEQQRTQSSLATRYRTPYRNMINMFGREQGEKIFNYLFAPTVENGAEMIRWKNRMLNEVREIEGSDGKKKELNEKERALTQMVLEGRAIGEQVKNMVDGELIQYAAEELRKGKAIDDISNEFGLHSKDARQAAQDYAAWMDVQEMLDTTKGVDKQRILNAVEKYSEQYNKFYAAINDVLISHGYEPIGFIKGYAPHLQTEENQNLLQKALKSLGVKDEVYSIPASIAGQTYQYRPNKRWNPYFQHRNGNQTSYDIAEGYESYLDYMADIVYHMDDIIRARRMVNYYRTKYSPEEIRESLSWAEGLRTMPTERKGEWLRDEGKLGHDEYPSNERINQMFEDYVSEKFKDIKATGKYNDVVTWLEDYANGLAAKQSDIDRSSEALLGRNALNIAGKFNRLFAQSNVAGNASSTLNQTAQIPLIIAQNGYINYYEALLDYARRPGIRKEFRDGSDFLTMKAGVDNLVIDPAAKVLNLMFKPSELLDSMTSYLATRSAYYKAIREGKTHEEAMQYADRMGEQLMGSRAKENAPTVFRSRNPLLKMVNTFQIEALNTFEYVAQDTIIQGIRDIKQISDTKGRTKAIAALVGLVTKMLINAFIHNRLSEELYGGTPTQFDLGGYAAEFLASGRGITVNDQLKHWINLTWEKITGEPLFDEDVEYNEEFEWGSAFGDLSYSVTSDIPFVRSLMGLMGVGDETLPMQDLSTIKDAVESLAENGMGMETLDKAITAASEFIPGGRQIRKTTQGLRTMAEGARYYGYGDNERLQYTVDDTALNWIKAALFGPNGLSETNEFYASGDSGWGATTTQKYQDLIQNGLTEEQAYEVVVEYQRINALESMSASEKAMEFKRTLVEMRIDEELQEKASEAFGFYTVIRGQAAQYDKLVEEGLSADEAAELTTALSDLEPEGERTTVSNLQKYQEIISYTSNETTRYAALAGVMSEKEMARFRAAYDYVDSGDYVEFLGQFNDTYPGESKSQERVKTVLDGMNLDKDAKAALWQACNSSWKPENNPYKVSVGKEVAQAIQAAYEELNGK